MLKPVMHICTVCLREMKDSQELKTVGGIPYHAACADLILQGEPAEVEHPRTDN